jgi:glycosyltransferase involved in cell wall biosynthesis
LKNLIIAIKKYRPNIVHIVNGSIKSNLIIREFLAEHSIPFIVTEQFIDDSLKLTSDILERVQTANNRACKTIYVSQGNAGIAKEKFNLLNDNSVVIYNAILPFKKKKSFFRSKPLRVFTTGRCVEQKGIDIIIRAISLLKNHPVEFHFIGDGEKRNEYLTLADMLLKSNQQFIVTDWKNPINYIPFFKHFDLYVSASRQEGFSFGLLEAASSGFPMICSDCSGNDELIRLCKRGELFSADNEIELCSLLSDFWEDPKPLNTKALMNTKTVDQIFDIRQSILQLERIYFELLSL